MRYTVKKRVFKKQQIRYMEILFDNGDCLPISALEVVDLSLNLYDKLTLRDGSHIGVYCPSVHDGYIKLNLKNKSKGLFYNPKVQKVWEYNKDRIGYIKNRLVSENGMLCVKLYDKNNWHFSYYGNMSATLNGENLTIHFTPKAKDEPFESDEHYIFLPELNDLEFYDIELDLENCEGIYVDSKEISEFKIVMDKQLQWGSEDYIRRIESGYMKIVLDPEKNAYRRNHLFDKLKKGDAGNRQIERRLAGKNLFDLHDICNLYVEYANAYTLASKCEEFSIDDIRTQEEFDAIEKYEKEHDCSWGLDYFGGYCEKQRDGSLLVTFGEFAIQNKNCQELLKKYSVSNAKD